MRGVRKGETDQAERRDCVPGVGWVAAAAPVRTSSPFLRDSVCVRERDKDSARECVRRRKRTPPHILVEEAGCHLGGRH